MEKIHKQIIRQIVNRCHVGDSDEEVINYMISRIKGGQKTWKTLAISTKEAMAAFAIKVHRQNQDLYGKVMGGLL